MKKILIFLSSFILLLSMTTAFAQNSKDGNTKTGTILVIVNGFNNDTGDARIGLYNSRDGYKNERWFQGKKVQIINGKVEFTFKDVPFGEYVVAVHHDENRNGKYDWTVLGKSEA